MSGSEQPYKRCHGTGCGSCCGSGCGASPREQNDPIVTIKVQSSSRGEPPRFDFRVQSAEREKPEPEPQICQDCGRPSGCLCPVLALAAAGIALLLLL